MQIFNSKICNLILRLLKYTREKFEIQLASSSWFVRWTEQLYSGATCCENIKKHSTKDTLHYSGKALVKGWELAHDSFHCLYTCLSAKMERKTRRKANKKFAIYKNQQRAKNAVREKNSFEFA